jgi:uncharacterized protein involved in outer membrane biogenesis
LSAIGQAKQAKAEAKAITQEGALNAANKARETRIKAARIKSSFLQSGLELEGTPSAAISDTFNVGIADTEQIIKNANTRSRNVMSSAFNSAVSGIASSVGMAAMGGFGASQGAGFSANSFGQTLGSGFSSSPTGPYQPLGF